MPQHSQPLDLAEALARLKSQLSKTPASHARKLAHALYQTLANDVLAPVDLPPFPASAMDGYAIRADDWHRQGLREFRCAGTSLAGHPFTGTIAPGECVRVFTGAAVPAGLDQILLQERCLNHAGDRVEFADHNPDESYVRPVAHDIAKGHVLAQRGQRLTPFVLGSLNAAGVDSADVYQPLRVGVFSTGDELVDPSVPPAELQPGQIYDSNRATLLAFLNSDPRFQAIDLGRIADDAKQTREALAAASTSCEALLTSGGVSVGDADYVTGTIQTLGKLDIWRLNLRPGKPMAIGSIGSCAVMGLPGNPVSTIVTFLMVARPALLAMAGVDDPQPLKVPARLATPLGHQAGRMEFQRGHLEMLSTGLSVAHTGDQSSNRLSSFSRANCLIEVPKERDGLQAGEQVFTLPFDGLL
ncbi:MAG: gephyrin-like molybdotransferase Glp [Pseudomonadota bacterium]